MATDKSINEEITYSKPLNNLEECLSPWKVYREDIINQKLDLEKQIDKTVFAISSGALGISLAFIDKITPHTNYNYFYWILLSGWFSLIAAILLQTITLANTSKQIRNNISNVEEILQSKSIKEVQENEDKYHKYWNEQNMVIDRRNKKSFIFMISGVLILVVFSFLSLLNRENSSSRNFEITQNDSLINKNKSHEQ